MYFDSALMRILQTIARSDPRLSHVYFSKIDVADVFYRIWIQSEDVPRPGVIFPDEAGEEPIRGFPLVLTMGWKQLPPIFMVATETVAYLANQCVVANDEASLHGLDVVSETAITEEPLTLATDSGLAQSTVFNMEEHCHHAVPSTVKNWDVYVDDFIGVVQGNRRHHRFVKLVLLSSIDYVLRRLDMGGSEY
jgi:hypothetical protein